jgi:hypothetical protein
MFNLNSKPQSSASTSPHAMSGWVTPCLQGNRQSFECISLLNLGASNAFLPTHYWNPCLIERYVSNLTALLNFYRYLQKSTWSAIPAIPNNGIRAVFISSANMLLRYLMILGGGVRFLLGINSEVSATPEPRRTQ